MKTLLCKLRDQQAGSESKVSMPLPPGLEFIWYLGAQAAIQLIQEADEEGLCWWRVAEKLGEEVTSSCDRIVHGHGEEGLPT